MTIVTPTPAERASPGVPHVTPYWRVVTSDGRPDPEHPGGADDQQRYLELAGLQSATRGQGNVS